MLSGHDICKNMGTFTSKERRPEEGIVDKIIGEDCVVVFSTKTCSFCQKAKDSLSNMGIPFNAVELDEPGKESSKIVTDLTKITGERTVCVCKLKYLGLFRGGGFLN